MSVPPVDPLEAVFLRSEEFEVPRQTAAILMVILLLARFEGGCDSAEEARVWATERGYVAHIEGTDQDYVTGYGEWAASVWASVLSGRAPELTT